MCTKKSSKMFPIPSLVTVIGAKILVYFASWHAFRLGSVAWFRCSKNSVKLFFPTAYCKYTEPRYQRVTEKEFDVISRSSEKIGVWREDRYPSFTIWQRCSSSGFCLIVRNARCRTRSNRLCSRCSKVRFCTNNRASWTTEKKRHGKNWRRWYECHRRRRNRPSLACLQLHTH